MTFSMLLRTFFEILMFVAVIWCIFHEDRLAAAEKRFFCAVKRRRLKLAAIESAKPSLRLVRAKTTGNG